MSDTPTTKELAAIGKRCLDHDHDEKLRRYDQRVPLIVAERDALLIEKHKRAKP